MRVSINQSLLLTNVIIVLRRLVANLQHDLRVNEPPLREVAPQRTAGRLTRRQFIQVQIHRVAIVAELLNAAQQLIQLVADRRPDNVVAFGHSRQLQTISDIRALTMNVTGALAIVVFRQQLLRIIAVDHAGLVLFGKWIHQHGGFTRRRCTDDDIGAPLLRDLAGVVVRLAGIAAALVKLFQHLRPELLALRRLDVGGIHLRQRTNFRHLRNTVNLLPAHVFSGGQPVDRRLQLRAGFGLLGGGALRFFRRLRFAFCVLIIRSFS